MYLTTLGAYSETSVFSTFCENHRNSTVVLCARFAIVLKVYNAHELALSILRYVIIHLVIVKRFYLWKLLLITFQQESPPA